jgi:hypothetical protein
MERRELLETQELASEKDLIGVTQRGSTEITEKRRNG